jgi:hypothetical protein
VASSPIIIKNGLPQLNRVQLQGRASFSTEHPAVEASSGSGLKKVLYSTLFLAFIGAAGTVYLASDNDSVKANLKNAFPGLPWDDICSHWKSLETTLRNFNSESPKYHNTTESKETAVKLGNSTLSKETKTEVQSDSEDKVKTAPSKPAVPLENKPETIKSTPVPPTAAKVATPSALLDSKSKKDHVENKKEHVENIPQKDYRSYLRSDRNEMDIVAEDLPDVSLGADFPAQTQMPSKSPAGAKVAGNDNLKETPIVKQENLKKDAQVKAPVLKETPPAADPIVSRVKSDDLSPSSTEGGSKAKSEIKLEHAAESLSQVPNTPSPQSAHLAEKPVLPSEGPVTVQSKAVISLARSLDRVTSYFVALANTTPEVRPSISKITEVLKAAQQDLHLISEQLNLLTDEKSNIVSDLVAQQMAEFEKILKQKEEAIRARFTEDLDAKLKESEAAQAVVAQEHHQQLALQKKQWMEETSKLLESQAQDLEKTWQNEMNAQLDQERNGRLARLDHLALRLKYLESICAVHSTMLDTCYYKQSLYSALQALHTMLFETPDARYSFKAEWALLRKIAGEDQLLNAVLDSVMEDVQGNGIASFADLHSRFANRVVPEVRKASLLPATEFNLISRLKDYLAAQIPTEYQSYLPTPTPVSTALPPIGLFSYTLSSLGSYAGFNKLRGIYAENDVESILARVEYHLQREDLDMATRELNLLQGWPKILVSDWLNEARRHLEVKLAMEVMHTKVGLLSLDAI